MLLCKDRKICVFENPKTGSITMRKLFGKYLLNEKVSHETYKDLGKIVPDAESYEIFCFYRNPLDRYVSAVTFLEAWLPKQNMIPYAAQVKEELAALIPNIQNIVFVEQVYWLDFPNVTLLDYNNYENEIRKLGMIFDLDIREIPKLNVSSPDKRELTEKDILELKEVYREDYAFFASRGISFS
jgi:hypothetical protein